MKKNLFLVSIVTLILFSCSKTAVEDSIQLSNSSSNTLTPYIFDWENDDVMPAPSGTTILSPFASGANQSFPANYITDNKQTDGWELVYNTFSPTQIYDPKFFVLYNKYRGILRAFFYKDGSSPIASSYLSHTIKLKDNYNTPILNYASSPHPVAYDNIQDIANVAQPYQAGSTGTWYAAEFEMSYDPNTSSLSAANNLLQWDVNAVNITQFTMEGQSQGTIKGSVTQKQSASSLFSSVISGAIHIGGLAVLDQWTSLPLKIKDPIKKGINSGLSGVAKNIMSAIFGGSSTTSYVNLKTAADYEFTGSYINNSLVSSPSLVIPGTNGQNTVTGFTPLYKDPLGIFTLSNTPIVEGEYFLKTSYLWIPPDIFIPWDVVEPQLFKLKANSFNIIFNPTIINSTSSGATIANLKKEIIGIPSNKINAAYRKVVTNWNLDETINKEDVYVTDASNSFSIEEIFLDDGMSTTTGEHYTTGDEMKYEFLRISFDVLPINGAPKSTIVKTFKVNFEGSTIDKR